MRGKNPKRKKNRLKTNWLKKAVAALCSAVLLVGLAEGVDSLNVQAEDDTKVVTMELRFYGDKAFESNTKKAATDYMGRNNLVLTIDGTTTSYNSTSKECDDTLWESSGYVAVRYTVSVPKNINNFIYLFDKENLKGSMTVSGTTDATFTANLYGCYFVDGDRLLNSAYYRENSVLPQPASPKKSGYVFQRWVTSDKGNTEFDFTTLVNSVRIAYASWQDWALDKAGHLIISSQDGMRDWSTKATEEDRAGVKTVEVTESITEIPGTAFENCSEITAVTLRGKTPPLISAGTFDGCKFMSDGKRGLIVPGDSIDIYKEEIPWNDYACYMTQYSAATAAHDYNPEWQTDDTYHWRVCDTCGEEAFKEEHKEDLGTVTKEPTEEETGLRVYKCTVCGYETRTEEIPVIVNPGVIDKEVKKRGDVPSISIATSTEELQRAVLTESDRERVEKGENSTISLTVENAKDSVSNKDKKLIEEKLDGYQVGEYLDIRLIKMVGADSYQVEEVPGGYLRLVIQIPQELKNTDSTRTRDFRIIRVHDEAATILYDLDDNEDTITIDTDLFSTYALVYADTENTPGDNNNNNPPSNGGDPAGGNTNTGNNATGNGTNTGNTATGNSANTGRAATGGNTSTTGGTTAGGTAAGSNTSTGSGASNQARSNALRTGDVAPVGFYTVIALCFLAVMIALERRQQLNVIRLVRKVPRPY